MDRLGVGFIGAGFIARFMAASWTGIRGADIAAVYNHREPSAKSLAAYTESLGMKKPKAYTDIHEMLGDPEVDAVWVMTPNFARVETIKAVAEEAKQGRNDLVGVACEKPLGRTVDEAREMIRLIDGTGLLHGYLENQVFSPSVVKGKEAVWRHGAANTGRPYLARAAEEHGGPHNGWFWDPRKSGGGVLLDMSCHSLEVDRHLLTDPGKPKSSLKPVKVQGHIASLKWTREPYLTELKETYGVDYSVAPAEDYASVNVVYEDDEGQVVLSEAKTSWNYVGPGLRLSLEALGPEYSLAVNSLNQELNVFFSRNVKIPASEEFLEKQAAEQGLIPIIPDEAVTYGYQHENRHMVKSFKEGTMPEENWGDGLLITQLMMTAYKSAEEEKTLRFSPGGLQGYKPQVMRGVWKP
ncbi:Gfo/Idh/MocA family oxidoreductase [Candidatus Bathyarchaeota archaeon]|nr:Gfo/Idh/MocA family oxidoreductase [Candidatus Bathyarchaeota archaeon]